VQALSNLKTYANFGIVLFIVWSLISWLVGMNFSLEGKQYWLLKSAPVFTDRLVTGKSRVAYLSIVISSWSIVPPKPARYSTGPY